MIIKVCGMREAENIQAVERLDIDWMGFIFYEKSKRHVSQLPHYMPTQVKRIGVFVDYSIEKIKEKVEEFGFDGVQLHGSETPEYCQQLRHAIDRPILINKAFGIATLEDLEKAKSYEGVCNYYVFDTKTPTKGGAGYSFDWSLLQQYQGTTPFLLSGGIGLENVEEVKAFNHPHLAGVDLNSKFETSPAFKDAEKLNSFIKKLKNNE